MTIQRIEKIMGMLWSQVLFAYNIQKKIKAKGFIFFLTIWTVCFVLYFIVHMHTQYWKVSIENIDNTLQLGDP